MWITPYGQLRSQLPQPMQLSAMNTSPFGARWIASGGQSFMQCGCSQWRHDVGTCTLAKVGPASRFRREVPPWVSAQAFSQLSQRTHSDSSMSRMSVASPAPCASRKEMMSPPLGSACLARFAAVRWRYSDCRRRRSTGMRLTSFLNDSPSRRTVSLAIAARAVAERRDSPISAISPT
jgi:hypothetical protein